MTALRRLIFGAPIATSRAHHERLPKLFGLPVFASDNISSVAYATEEILLMLSIAGAAALGYVTWIALAIVVLVLVVITSYTRTIYAYPQGGGDYRVTSDNLGSKVGRITGAALLIDYTLTVAVSVSAGVLAIVSAFPNLQPYTVHMALAAVAAIAMMNLRGMRESGLVFALPTYAFVGLMLALIVAGLMRAGTHPEPVPVPVEAMKQATAPLTLWLILRAFAAGCAALTGIEAIADSVPAFRKPAAYNASRTLWMLGAILVVIFLGMSWMARHYGVVAMDVDQPGYRTVVAQLAATMFGEGGMFYVIQISTMLILVLAANTAFADFPRLCSFIAGDSFLPRQLSNLGDRLVFQNGIILLAVASGALIFVFGADVHRLIPLYALGVFTAFTLGQAGMVVRQVRLKARWWGPVISFIGMVATGTVWVVILTTKFMIGAWIIVVGLMVLLAVFWGIRRHYRYLTRALTPVLGEKPGPVDTTVLLLVPRIHRGILTAIAYARTLSKDIRAVYVNINPDSVEEVKREWDQFAGDIPLVVLEAPYRSLVDPILEYIDEAVGERENHMLTVILPQAVPKHWWQGLLHNNAALPLKLALASRKNVVVTNVRYFLE
ncbi:MAG: APC family permease [Armatimonadetes bacterium]|nr:APC family permease [Armatimonadota bacterium]